MTTNRLETMDVAFQSRIQMAIEYKSLSVAARRKIWTNMINRVDDEDAREELLEELDFLKRQDLNGREIQNVVRVAQSLALGRGNGEGDGRGGSFERLSIRHIRKALDQTLSFQQYFKSRKEVSKSRLQVNMQSPRNVKSPRETSRDVDDDDDDE